MSRVIPFRRVFPLLALLLVVAGCERTRSSPPSSTIPPDLQATVENLVQAVEAFDVPRVLTVYADDFTSGTGRTKEEVAEIFAQLRASRVSLAIERAEVEEATPAEAKLKTRIRLRYTDHFQDLGEGEVIITDVLVHSLRKHTDGWKIYTDQRVASYRDGRFGRQPPNLEITVPEQLPSGLEYPVQVSVRREAARVYQVMIGNYAEDPGFLPPPDIVTMLPEDGVLKASLIPNPRGLSEMVRITVIAADLTGQWLGATTVSKLVPGVQRQYHAPVQKAV
jgi:hypothetical protein